MGCKNRCLGLLLACTLLGLVAAQECPCEEVSPSDEFTCVQQREFGQCEKDWMVGGGFCECACGRCEATESEPVLTLAEDLPEKPEEVPKATAEPTVDLPEETEDKKEEKEEEEKPVATKETPKAKAAVKEEPEEIEESSEESDPETIETDEDEDSPQSLDIPDVGRSDLLPLRKFWSKGCSKSVAEAISEADELTSFATLLKSTDFFEILHDKESTFTVFAPTDAAFEDLGVSPTVLAKKTEKITILVGYHIVPEVVTPTILAKPTEIDTLAPKFPLFGGSSKEIEGLGSSAKTINRPVSICGSLVYLVDEVLLPAVSLDAVDEEDVTESKIEDEQAKSAESCKQDFDAFFAISSDEDLSMFTEAMNTAELSGFVADSTNHITLLAPTNEAVTSSLEILGVSFEDLLKDVDMLRGILEYHIIEENIEGPEFVEGVLTTMNTTTLYVEVGNSVEFAGTGTSSRAIETDIDLACGSAVHKIDMVLLPFKIKTSTVVTSSSGTVVHSARKEKPAPPPKSVPVSRKATGCQVGHLSVYEVVNQNPQLKVFSQIMQFSNMISLFTDKSLKATIFAPVDYAFGNLLEPGKGFFDLVPDRLIAQTLIAYHIAGAPVLSRYFTDGLEAGTNLSSKGKQLMLEIIEDPLSPTKLAVEAAYSQANIIKTDLIGCNSVIHIVDAVLLPSPKLLPSKSVSVQAAVTTAETFASLLDDTEVENKGS